MSSTLRLKPPSIRLHNEQRRKNYDRRHATHIVIDRCRKLVPPSSATQRGRHKRYDCHARPWLVRLVRILAFPYRPSSGTIAGTSGSLQEEYEGSKRKKILRSGSFVRGMQGGNTIEAPASRHALPRNLTLSAFLSSRLGSKSNGALLSILP